MRCSTIVFFVLLLVITFKLNAQNWNEIIKVVASDRGSGDNFGSSVAIWGDFAIVGSPYEGEDTTGRTILTNAGSAYIFKNVEGRWTEVQKLVASDREDHDFFGFSVDISGDYAIVGAWGAGDDTAGGASINNRGAAYIFKNIGGTWSEIQRLLASDGGSNDSFGRSVGITGNYALVGAETDGHDSTGGTFLTGAGSAYIFENISGIWSEVQKLVASDRGSGDRFGSAVSISGDFALIGAWFEDHDAASENFLKDAGSAYIFKNNAGRWSEVKKLVGSDRGKNDGFGFSVCISAETAIVGAWKEDHDTTGRAFKIDAGSAYVFKNNSGNWSEVQKLVASDRTNIDAFGYSVGISENIAIVGASSEDHDTTGGSFLNGAGSAYIFKNISGSWSEVQKLVASDRDAYNIFGEAVGISGSLAMVGAVGSSADTSGRDTLPSSGSVYVFSCATQGKDVHTSCDSFTWIDSVTYTASNNTATYTLTNAAGCDSVVTLDLTITGIDKSRDSVKACYSYFWTNTGITYDSSGIYFDTLTSVSGCDSIIALDLEILNASDSVLWVDVLDSFIWVNTNTTYYTSGLYYDTLKNSVGCDSIITLDLIVENSPLTIIQQSSSLKSENEADSYQWVDCNDNYSAIVGATQRSYEATKDGSYAVKLKRNNKEYMTECVTLTIGLNEHSISNFTVFPNPTNGQLTIEFDNYHDHLSIRLISIIGQEQSSNILMNSNRIDLELNLPPGIYLLEIMDNYGNKEVIKVMKQ